MQVIDGGMLELCAATLLCSDVIGLRSRHRNELNAALHDSFVMVPIESIPMFLYIIYTTNSQEPFGAGFSECIKLKGETNNKLC